MDPRIPASWPGFEIRWRFGSALYTITVENHGQRGRDAVTATLDGRAVDRRAIPLTDDGQRHEVRIVLGGPPDGRPEVVAAQTASR
jgi:cellobiose phosphorylase